MSIIRKKSGKIAKRNAPITNNIDDSDIRKIYKIKRVAERTKSPIPKMMTCFFGIPGLSK
jgi:hypothetical protein